MTKIALSEQYGHHRTKSGITKSYEGEVELIIKDITGHVIHTYRFKNIVKINAKEMLSHRIAHNKIWDPNANSGTGAWVVHNIDIDEFAAKYIVFGASFDNDGTALDSSDERYYQLDNTTNMYVPITLGIGAEYDGGLVNAIPISEPGRPLKRIERIFFESSYQPAGNPLMQDDVRAMNNIIVLETTLRANEYNGFGLAASDYFTITEIALVGAAELSDPLGACECDPRDIFLTGTSDGDAQLVSLSGEDTISIASSESEVNMVREGDQIKLVAAGSTAAEDDELDQLNPYYLIVSKASGGRDITLDRTPVDTDGAVLTGQAGILRDGFKIFSHRILNNPVRKNALTEIVVRWRLLFA